MNDMRYMKCCGNCKHYKEAYCNLMDELVEPLDSCGMCDLLVEDSE